MNNQSSCIDHAQPMADESSFLGDNFSPLFKLLKHLSAQHGEMTAEAAAVFLRFVRNWELTEAGTGCIPLMYVDESPEGIAFLQEAELISKIETGGVGTLALTERGTRLAAEVSALFVSEKASPPQV